MANIIQTFPRGTDEGQSIQYDAMPTPSSSIVDKIVQYTGTTTSTYTNGWFYKCVEDSTTTPSTYSWERVELSDLMPASDMSEVVDHLPTIGPTPGGSGGYDNVIEGYYNYSDSLFYYDIAYTLPVDGENRVIYLSLDTNIIYRYDGSIFIPITTVSDIQVVSLPTADASKENTIYQYVGATDATYTNGWFYKCVKDTSATPVSYSWEKVEMIEYMPSADMAEVIPTMPSVKVAYPFTYSTDEQVVGKWIDGKPLYQKTIDCTSIRTGGDLVINLNVNKIASITGIGERTSDGLFRPIPSGDSNTNYDACFYYYRGTNTLTFKCGSGISSVFDILYATLQYTKTTD